MTILNPLIARNRSWALQQCQSNPHYFRKRVAGQQPQAQEDSALARRMAHLRHSLEHNLQDYPQAEDDDATRLNRLIDAHVVTQFTHLIASAPERRCWEQGKVLDVLGCVYDLQEGHLKEFVHQNAAEVSHELQYSA